MFQESHQTVLGEIHAVTYTLFIWGHYVIWYCTLFQHIGCDFLQIRHTELQLVFYGSTQNVTYFTNGNLFSLLNVLKNEILFSQFVRVWMNLCFICNKSERPYYTFSMSLSASIIKKWEKFCDLTVKMKQKIWPAFCQPQHSPAMTHGS